MAHQPIWKSKMEENSEMLSDFSNNFHVQMDIAQNRNISDESADDSVDSGVSDRVVTQSPGTFGQIPELFSQSKPIAEKEYKGKQAPRMNEQDMKERSPKRNHLKTHQHTDENNGSAKHGNLCDTAEPIAPEQTGDATSAVVRKRKLTDQSEKSLSPGKDENCENIENNKAGADANDEEETKSTLFPVFCKKDIKDSAKDQREVKRKLMNRAAKKKQKMAEAAAINMEDNDDPSLENLQVLDVRLVMSMFNKLKREIATLKASSIPGGKNRKYFSASRNG